MGNKRRKQDWAGESSDHGTDLSGGSPSTVDLRENFSLVETE